MTLQEIQDGTLAILSKYLRAGDRVALLDFPNHGNSGDSLIYLGELAYLARLGVFIDYVADASRYSAEDLRALVPEGPVLIHGGGNFGDRWQAMQATREKIVADLPDRRIIQLPQSIEFSDGPALRRAQRILNEHKDLTLLIRDSEGVVRTRTLFPNATVEFCPDMAFGYGWVDNKSRPKNDVIVLKRKDSESIQGKITVPADFHENDWGLSGHRRLVEALLRLPGAFIKRVPIFGKRAYFLQRHCYDELAKLHVQNAVRILSSGRIVVTDRLHATVLAGLMSKPVIALNNANGKIELIYKEYLSQLPGVAYARTHGEVQVWVSENI